MSLKLTRHHLAGILLGIGLGILIGFGIKAGRAALLTESSPPELRQQASERSTQDESRGLSLQRSTKDRAFEDALMRSGRTQRWLWLATQAESARASDMPRLLRLAGDDYELSKMLGAHWAKLDPKQMIQVLIEEDRLSDPSIVWAASLISQALHDWVTLDALGVIDFLSDNSMYETHWDHRMTTIEAVMREDPGLGLPLLAEWGIDSYLPSMRKVAEWAEDDPVTAAGVIANVTSKHVREDAMEELGKTWAAKDPEAGLEHALNTLKGSAGRELAASVMKHWSTQDLDNAIAFASSQDDPLILAAMSGPLAAAWAKTDPEAALTWSEESLSSAARANAVGAIIASVAKEDFATGRTLATELGPGRAKQQAAVSLLESWLKQDSPDGNAIGSWLAELEDTQAQTRAINRAQWRWAKEHPESAKAFITGEHGHLATDTLVSQIVSQEVRADPHAALVWAAALEGDQRTRAQSSIATEWYNTNPTAAITWVTQEARGDLQTQAIENISKQLVYQSEDRLRAWVDRLDADSRQVAHEAMTSLRLPEKHARTLEKVLPNP